MEIKRIDTYDDLRFREKVLRQHGCFLMDGEPCEVEIIDETTAMVFLGKLPRAQKVYGELIETFRFYAGHITRFLDEEGALIKEFPPVSLFPVKLTEIQPSQFFVDREKLLAVREFTARGKDIRIPLIPFGERYISCDGHTRLYLAAEKGIREVWGFLAERNEDLLEFAEEAQRRGVFTPMDLEPLSHVEYEKQWDQYCDDFFRAKEAGS